MSESRPRQIDLLSAALALVPLIPIAIDASGIIFYRQGLRNAPMDFAPSALAVAVVLSFAIACLAVRCHYLSKQRDPRTTMNWLLLILATMLWPALCAARPTPVQHYRRGLADWARANVDVPALRAWQSKLPPTTAPARLPPTPVPTELLRLNPTFIEQLPTGLLVQWGTRAQMPGRERRLFIAADASIQPPAEGRRFWTEIEPGVHMGVHDP